jgi:hypothetical protein
LGSAKAETGKNFQNNSKKGAQGAGSNHSMDMSQETVQQDANLEPFRFRPCIPVPGGSGNLFLFGFDAPELLEARVIEIPPEVVHDLVYFSSFYPMLVRYFGVSKIVERLCEEHIGFWESLAASWHISLAACCLIHQAVEEAACRLVSLYNLWKEDPGTKEPMYFPFSVMLGWSLHQAAAYYLEDFATWLESPNALVPDGPRAKKAAENVRDFFQPFFDLFPKDKSPYLAVLDLQGLSELLGSLYPSGVAEGREAPVEATRENT